MHFFFYHPRLECNVFRYQAGRTRCIIVSLDTEKVTHFLDYVFKVVTMKRNILASYIRNSLLQIERVLFKN